MPAKENIIKVSNRIGGIADSVQRKLKVFVFVGVVASAILAFKVFNIDAVWWWNIVKLSVVFLPALVWLMVLFVLNQLSEAPDLVSTLINDDDGLFENINSFSVKEPNGLRGLVSTLRAFRQEEGFETVFDTISGIGLMVNPVFALFAFFTLAILFMFILIAPLVLLF